MSFGPQKNCFCKAAANERSWQVAARNILCPSQGLWFDRTIFYFDQVTHNQRPAYGGQEEPWGLGAMTAPIMLLFKEVYLTTPAH
jgi:hypothetical protein